MHKRQTGSTWVILSWADSVPTEVARRHAWQAASTLAAHLRATTGRRHSVDDSSAWDAECALAVAQRGRRARTRPG